MKVYKKPSSSEHNKDLLIKNYMSAVHKRSCQKENSCPKHMGPKKLFRRIAQNNEPIKDIVFISQKKKELERRK